MKIESHASNIVQKPWGYEYLVYENSNVALWFLFIAHNQQTSFHAHPNKTTGLINLDGEAKITFFDNEIQAAKLEKVSIRKGFFHSTKSTSQNGTFLFEIETPNDKLDLVRLRDNYGREGKPYEDSSYEFPKKDDCLSIETLEDTEINFCNCNLILKKINTIDDLFLFDDNTNIMFLEGGLLTDYDVKVINPADIVKVKIVKELSKAFNKIAPETYVMIFLKNE